MKEYSEGIFEVLQKRMGNGKGTLSENLPRIWIRYRIGYGKKM